VASTYVNNLRLEEMTTGEKSGTWGNITNTNLQLVGQALGYGTRAIANASTDNITIADGASDADRSMYLKLTGGGQACTVTLLPNTSSKMWIMENATSYTLTFTQGSGANVAILAGQTKMIFADGLGAGAVVYELGTIAVQNLSVTGVTSNADGSAAAPSLSFADDIDTGFYRAGANSIGVVLGGTEELTLNSTKASALDALGSVMSSTATAAAQRAALAATGNLVSIQKFTSSGTWTKPSGVTRVCVQVRGGGGGGGAATSTADIQHAAGGGQGGYSEKLIDVSAISTETVTIGALGGGGGGGGTGNQGGTSSFGAHCSATGGAGGEGGSAGLRPRGGAGGSGSGGDINRRGQGGMNGMRTGTATHGIAGMGGGEGNGRGSVATDGEAAEANSGAGGGGAEADGGNPGGGAGGSGLVTVWEYQ
jgi:hypothetical protein